MENMTVSDGHFHRICVLLTNVFLFFPIVGE